MKLLLICTTLIVSLFFIASCQQEIDAPVNNGVNSNDSIYLSKEIELDTSLATGSDTLTVYQFYYDTNKRLLHVAGRGYADGTFNMNSTENEYRFYNNTDTVPNKIVSIIYDAVTASISTDTSFLFYNSNGFIVKDSLVDYYNGTLYSKERADYIPVNSGKCIIKNTQLDISTGAIIDMDSSISNMTIVNSNVSSSNDSVYNAGTLKTVYKFNATYTTKFNPIQRITLRFPAHIWYYFFSYYDPSFNVQDYGFFQENNIGGQTYTDYSTNKIDYNSLGYPTVIRYINPTSADLTYKRLFFYTN